MITGENWSTTITGLPQKEGGQEIAYYVSENAVAEYKLTALGDSVQTSDGKTAYPVINESVTLTNTHTPGTVEYTVTLTWDDKDNVAGMRPGTVTVNLGNEKIVLTVSDGQIVPPEGEQYAFVTDGNGGGILTIKDLPEFEDGKQQTYQGSVDDIADYDETITAFGPNSVSYKLSYTGSTSYEDGLGFTKVWEEYNYNGYDMRPSTSEYAQYLTLSVVNGEPVTATPTITEDQYGNYIVTYSGLPMYSGGQAIQYQVIERNVPNFTTENFTVALTENNAERLTNTFTLVDPDEPGGGNTYGQITVTKVWNDADAPEGKRPTDTSVEKNVLGIMLYREGTTVNGIKPTSISVNGDTWTYTWDAGTVLKTDKDGSTIDYVAYENTVPENYTATTQSANVTEDGNVVSSAQIVNAYSGTAATGTLTISKTWAGDEQYTDKRPDSLTFIVTGTFEGSGDATQITRTAHDEQGQELGERYG